MELAPLSEAEVRDVLNRWAAEGSFRLPNMGDKIFMDPGKVGWAYTFRLQTHYEQRAVTEAQVPYHGGPIDQHGRPPGAWDIPARNPGDFKEDTQTIPVPHTERVSVCGTCGGAGQATCSFCMGSGRCVCPRCGGSAIVQQTIMDTARTGDGNTIAVPRFVQRPCGCGNGRIVCITCGGRGIVVCGTCRGAGQLKTFDQVIVKFLRSKHGDLLDLTPVPDNWFGRLTGEVLRTTRATRIDHVEPYNEEIDKRVQALLDRSHSLENDQSRILLQQIHVERIPLHEVPYRYAGVERRLWICGNEKAVYAPDAPWNRSRLALLIASVLFGLIIFIAFFLYLFGS